MSPAEGDSGEDGSASEYERAENGSQEVRPSLMVSCQIIKCLHTISANINL